MKDMVVAGEWNKTIKTARQEAGKGTIYESN